MNRLAIAFVLGLWFAGAASAGPMPTAAESASVDAPGQLVVVEGPFAAVFEGVGTLSGSLFAGGIGVAGATFVGTMHQGVPSPASRLTVAVANQAGFFSGAPLGTGAPLVGTMPVRGFSRVTGFGARSS